MEAFNETYHVNTTHPEFMEFGTVPRLGASAGQAQQHRLRRAQGPGRGPGRSCALGTGDDPRISTAEMQNYTWRNANTNTTADAGRRRQPAEGRAARGHPADRGLGHWLDRRAKRRRGARRDLADRSIPSTLAQAGTAWQIFPNFQIGQGLTTALCYSARPYGYDPDKLHLRGGGLRALSRRPGAADRVGIHEADDPDWRTVLPQDFTNMAAVQQGMKNARFPRRQAQSLHGTQHGEPALPAVEVHGHRRTTGALRSMTSSSEPHLRARPT